MKRTMNEAARAGQPAFLILDEVQNLDNWAPQLKSLVDSSTVQVVVTGSSALRMEAGRDSLAGRITSLEAGTLSLTEIAVLRGFDFGEPYLKDNGLEALTHASFWTGLREHGQSREQTRDTGAYLRFLGDTLLLRLIPPLEIRLKRKRGSSKLCLVDHGLRASWLQEQIPLDPRKLHEQPELTVVAGHLAESVTGAILSTITGLDIAHFPERQGEPEVDFVLTIGVKRIPLEVKYQARIDPMRDTEGLRSFVEKAINNAPFGLLVTQDDCPAVNDPRIVTLPLSSLMLLR